MSRYSIQNASCAVLVVFLAVVAVSAQEAPSYDRVILPILANSCFPCHGPDASARKADLRLDVRSKAIADGGGFRAIVPGHPEKSEAWLRITAEDPADRMPPAKSKHKLAAKDAELLRRWIASGAQYDEHWAFSAPRAPEPPTATGESWVRNPIDLFVLARLKAEGLAPSPVASKETLIRRASLDLVGLPPELEAIDAFVADAKDDAWPRLVDRLLASPGHAERLTLAWLDASRYADTNGFSIDGGRHMWAWRDRVIESFRQNMPYDQFTIEQLAGDLLPEPTPAQRTASGFNRNHMITHEGGTILEEYLVKYAVDRVKTTATVWMGLTVGCAQCHDHKFDPLKQREFYELYAYFNTITDKGNDGDGGKNSVPSIDLPVAQERKRAAALAITVEATRRELDAAAARTALRREWEDGLRTVLSSDRKHPASTALTVTSVVSEVGATLERLDDGSWLATGREPERDRYIIEAVTDVAEIAGVTLTVLAHPSLPAGGPGRPRHGNFILSEFEVAIDDAGARVPLSFRRPVASHEQKGHPVADALDGNRLSGWGIAPRFGVDHQATFITTELLRREGRTKLRFVLAQQFGRHHTIGRFRLGILSGEVARIPTDIRAILAIADGDRDTEQRRRIKDHYREVAPALRGLRERLAALERELDAAKAASKTSVMVMEEMAKPRASFVLDRGQYDQKRERVQPGTPAFLPPMPADAPRNRLGFARWLVNPLHPLTARVTVNRLWQLCFGSGLVSTPGDFGVRGARPSHPALLDWLATELIRCDWDLRAMIRLIVDSATYRQTSRVSAALAARDPANRLLARGPRFRLQAELIRDNALAVSGLLVDQIGGPSVRPYQPPGLWREMSHFGSTPATAQIFVQDHGKRLYRRSLYTFWKRTVPPPNMSIFDAPSRETCTVRRESTNTPLQALVLLNDPTFVEAARTLAGRVLREKKGSRDRVVRLFRRVTGRRPSTAEIAIFIDAERRERARFREDPAAARALVAVGESPVDPQFDPVELAVWTQLATIILNLSETITRG